MSKNKFSNEMFEQLKTKLQEDKKGNNNTETLKLKSGNEYIVRLVPNIENPEKSIFRFFNTAWKSVKTGRLVFNLSPQTFGKPCPINEEFLKFFTDEDEAVKERCRPLSRKERWMVNVYVVDDPVTPDNNGKVMVLNYGKQLNAVIEEGIYGSDSDDVGFRAFDLSENGCNLRIKVEPQGEVTNLSSSKFKNPSKIPGMTQAKMDEVYEQAYDLEKVYPLKSYEELRGVLYEHFYGQDAPEVDGEPDISEEDTDSVTTIDPVDAEEVTSDVEDSSDDLIDEINFEDEDEN